MLSQASGGAEIQAQKNQLKAGCFQGLAKPSE